MTLSPEDVRRFLEEIHVRARVRVLTRRADWMAAISPLYPPDLPPPETAWLFAKGMSARPTCARCGGVVAFFGARYANTCSHACANRLHDVIGSAKRTITKRYGVEHIAQVPGVTAKRHATMEARYGAKVSPKTREAARARAEDMNAKGRDTLRVRYGVDNPGQLPGHAEKLRETMIARYGVAHPRLLPTAREARDVARLPKWQAILPDSVEAVAIQPPDRDAGEVWHRLDLRCVACGWEETMPTETVKFRIREAGTPCGRCAGISTTRSIRERNLAEAIRDIYDGPIVLNDRRSIRPLELDVLLPELSLAVEHSGLFWHSEDRLGADYHLRKMRACEAAGVRLVTVFEDEWRDRPALVLRRLSHLLGVSERGAGGARTLALDPRVRSEEARGFCEDNHLQGYANATHKLGLRDPAGRLLALMTFARPSLAKGQRGAGANEWELSRFCTAHHVPGAASRLFSAFAREHNPSKITSYADLRWNTGGVYAALGFRLSHVSKPNYWYFKGEERVHRFALRKTSADDPALTEVENRRLQGWKRIFDCGNQVWVWTHP